MDITTCHMQKDAIKGLDKLIKEFDIKIVLEYGSGFSTIWFSKRVEKVYTVDTNPRWFPKNIDNVTCIQMYADGKNIDVSKYRKSFDLILIDCYLSLRPKIFEYVKDLKWKILCVHDWSRDYKMYNEVLYSKLKQRHYSALKVWIR